MESKIKPLSFFKNLLWHEVARFDLYGHALYTVTCTEENIQNLFESQTNKNLYGEIFRYTN